MEPGHPLAGAGCQACLDGSAAHPVSPGPHKQHRRASADHKPAHAIIAPSDQREWPKQGIRALKGGSCRCVDQAGGKSGLVGFHRLRMQTFPPIPCARGAFLVKRRARRSMPQGMRDRARHQPRSSYGALRGEVPLEGVAQDAQRLALRGRLSPFRNRLFDICRPIRLCFWRTREQFVTKPLMKVDLVIGFVTCPPRR
jgi:hypothetical protein